MRIVGRMEQLGDHHFLSWQSDRENVSWIFGRGTAEVHPRRDFRAWSGERATRDDTKCEENTNDGINGRTGERETSRVQNSRRKAVVHVPGAC